MRVISKSECAYIGGGGPVAPAQTTQLTKQSPTVYIGSFNGITTTVVCTTPFSASLNLAINTKGKLVDANGGASVDTQSCTVTTVDTKTQIESVCKGTDCTTIDLKTGQKISETTVDDGDTGIEQLAQADSGDMVAFAGYDFSGGGGDDGGGGDGGWAGGDPGGGGVGDPEDGGGDGGVYG
ncbi:hypothetical protein [Duganella radicis]|uniref:Uncharacterized protein n=1 Tax=Duganella radicis TaxID=551988 RepID=A0A6L6PBZ9_9BURK|nr:hypothetical protein [Duganella radicis]MTV36648.1 hypothetical protein [Duganella radicis]